MKEKISLIGGDLRISNLAQMLEEDGSEVSVYGMEKSEEIMENKNIKKSDSLDEVIANSDIIIGSKFLLQGILMKNLTNYYQKVMEK